MPALPVSMALGLLALAAGLSLVLFAYGGYFLRVVPLLSVLALTYVSLSLHELWRANALINAEMRTLLADRGRDGETEWIDAPLLAAMSSLSMAAPGTSPWHCARNQRSAVCVQRVRATLCCPAAGPRWTPLKPPFAH